MKCWILEFDTIFDLSGLGVPGFKTMPGARSNFRIKQRTRMNMKPTGIYQVNDIDMSDFGECLLNA